MVVIKIKVICGYTYKNGQINSSDPTAVKGNTEINQVQEGARQTREIIEYFHYKLQLPSVSRLVYFLQPCLTSTTKRNEVKG